MTTADEIAIAQFANEMNLQRGKDSVLLRPRDIQIEVNSVAAAKSAVIAGLGIRQLPLSDIAEELATGELVQVLPKWQLPRLGIYAVWPDAGPQKALTRRLIDFFLAERDQLV